VVEPLSSDDWEVISLSGEYIERQLLNQMAAVQCPKEGLGDQGNDDNDNDDDKRYPRIPIWVNGAIVRLKVMEVEPSGFESLLLGSDTEFIVAPKVRKNLDEERKNERRKKRKRSARLRVSHYHYIDLLIHGIDSDYDDDERGITDGEKVSLETTWVNVTKATMNHLGWNDGDLFIIERAFPIEQEGDEDKIDRSGLDQNQNMAGEGRRGESSSRSHALPSKSVIRS